MKDVKLSEYKPKSELEVKEHNIEKPKFPVINFHTHFWSKNWEEVDEDEVKNKINKHKKFGVNGIINLGSFWGKSLEGILDLTSDYRDWITVFGSVDVTKVADNDFQNYASSVIEKGYKKGMKGLKFYKEFGLRYRDNEGNLLKIDDKRFKPIWATAAKLDIPVLIHVADPKAFFKPLDGFNERFEELVQYPHWHFVGDEFPTFTELIEMMENLISNNRDTTFIIPHAGCYSENLAFVSDLLDRYSNMYIDISARINELGRQPYTARNFLIDYQDRIVFGTDGTENSLLYPYYYRFLETWDEYFDYGPGNNRWKIYGVGLPDEVLRKIYYENALKLVPSLKKMIPEKYL